MVPKLVGDEVELTKGGPLVWLHLFQLVLKVADYSHLKHTKTNLYAKGPYLLHQLSDDLAPALPSNVIA